MKLQKLALYLAAALLPISAYADYGTWKKYQNSALSTTVASVKSTAGGSSGAIGGWYIYNPNATVCVLQIFDQLSTSAVTLGTTVPDLHLVIPATSGANVSSAGAIIFNKGIQIAAATTSTGSSACASPLDVNLWYY